jgi:Fe-S-cluster containining protein
MPNPDPLIKQYANKYSIERSKFENYLVSIRDECQKIIPSTCHPTYNEHHQNIIELIYWTIEKYTTANQEERNILLENKESEQIGIDNILEELDKKCLIFDTNYGIERHYEDRNPKICNMCGFTYRN